MERRHPDRGALARLAAGELSGPALTALLAHLSGCASCGARFGRATVARAARRPGGATPARSYGEAFQRASFRAHRTARRVRTEQRAAEPGIALLLDKPEPERAGMVRAAPGLRSHALARECLARSRQRWFDDPTAAEELAAVALLVADHLPSRAHSAAVLEDLRSDAWCHVANARRIRSDYSGAAEAFRWAEEHRRAGTGDASEEASYAGLYSTLLRECEELDGARDHLDHAIALHRYTGCRHLEARALISKWVIEWNAGDLDLAMSLLDRAAQGLEPWREPRLAAALSKNRALTTAAIGGRATIFRALKELDPGRDHGILDRLRTLWARGMLFEKLEQPEDAERAFRAARRGFDRARIPFDVALLNLDLGRLYLRMGRSEDAKQRAAAAFPTFSSRGLHQHTLRALDLFCHAGGLA